MRALLDLMRENEAAVKNLAAACFDMLSHASKKLTILDPVVGGEEEISHAVAAALANLRLCHSH